MGNVFNDRADIVRLRRERLCYLVIRLHFAADAMKSRYREKKSAENVLTSSLL